MNRGEGNTENTEQEIQEGGKKKKILIIGVIVVVVLVVTIVMTMRKGPKTEITHEEVVEIEEVEESEVEEIEESKVEEVDEDIDEKKDKLDYGYNNKVLGIRFNFDRSLYIKENTDELYNTLKEYTKEGTNFDTSKDKVEEMINIVKATTGEADGVAITVGIMPFDMGEVVPEEGQEPIKVADVLKEGLILDKYDKQIETKILEQGGVIENLEPSELTEEGYLVSERRYTEKSGKVVETKQAIIPAGVNAIVVTLVSDGRPLEYSKEDMFKIIVESIEIDIPGVEEQNKELPLEKKEEIQKEEEEIYEIEEETEKEGK